LYYRDTFVIANIATIIDQVFTRATKTLPLLLKHANGSHIAGHAELKYQHIYISIQRKSFFIVYMEREGKGTKYIILD